MLKVERWEVFYADGSIFTSDQGTWAECPPFGIQAIVYYSPEGVTFQEVGQDDSIYHYIGEAEGCDEPVKMGLWTDGETYWRVHDLAKRSVTP
jgi:hypothetical protein